MDYRDKTAVVTGAGSGIGRALTLELAGRGANVAASDVDAVGLAKTALLARSCAGAVFDYQLDVADRAAVLAHAEEISERFGSADLVINNAGVAVGASVVDMSWDDLDWLLNINLGGVINGTKAFLPQLIEHGGHLVNISSVFGLVGVPFQSAYCTAKFGVRGFTETLREEMLIADHPVTVHCVHPGGIRTNIARRGRFRAAGGERVASPGDEFDRVARTTPEKAATTILAGVERNKPRILVGRDAYLFAAVPRVIGARYQNLVGKIGRRRGAAITEGSGS
ncbi:MAG: SDR family NAD(P)-dependent oxidoreductase [Acidobacteria bacterium]|nr:SDR family NAD(P)-dependent oxidoreductase [Acidobacteriota bacterium]